MSVLKKEVARKRHYYDLEVQRRAGEILKIDHSFKVVSHLKQINEIKIFEGLLTVINEYGEIPGQYFVPSTGHAHLIEHLRSINNTTEQLAPAKLPKLIYTDRCCDDRSTLEEAFPSLKTNLRNMEYLPLSDFSMRVAADMNLAQLFSSELMESFLPDVGTRTVVGFDMEWRSDGVGGKTALIQLALCDQVFLFHLASIGDLPDLLTQFLTDERFLKVGRGISADQKKFFVDFNVMINPVEDIVNLCVARGYTDKRNVSLQKLTQLVLGYDLKKDDALRRSNWERIALSADQKEYAARDAVAALLIYKKAEETHGAPFEHQELTQEHQSAGKCIRASLAND